MHHLIKHINRHQWIAEAAYFRAEARQFRVDQELDDWLEAEQAYAKMLITAYVNVLAEDGPITLQGLQQLATLIGVENTDQLASELELVWAIQKAIDHRPCFRSKVQRICENKGCQWIKECRRLTAAWY